MDRRRDSFDVKEAVWACAAHAWRPKAEDGHREELQRRGIQSEAHLRQEIDRVVNDPRTKACHGYFRQNPEDYLPSQVLRREVYDLRPYNEANPGYGMTVILNPNRDPTGAVHGGTVYGRQDNEMDRLVKQEARSTGMTPEIVTGGRQALLDREQHRQVVEARPQQESQRTRHEEMFDQIMHVQDERLRSNDVREFTFHSREGDRTA